MKKRSEKQTGRAISLMAIAFFLIFYLINMPEINSFIQIVTDELIHPGSGGGGSNYEITTYTTYSDGGYGIDTVSNTYLNQDDPNAGRTYEPVIAPLSPIAPIVSLIFTAFIVKKRKYSNNE